MHTLMHMSEYVDIAVKCRYPGAEIGVTAAGDWHQTLASRLYQACTLSHQTPFFSVMALVVGLSLVNYHSPALEHVHCVIHLQEEQLWNKINGWLHQQQLWCHWLHPLLLLLLLSLWLGWTPEANCTWTVWPE